MNFILRMAVREIRASWQRLLFFFICIAVGVASIVAIRSVIQGVRVALAAEAQAVLAADFVVSSNRPFSDQVAKTLASEQQHGNITARAETVEVSTMVRPADPAKSVTKMVELRAVPPQFPFYGRIELQNGTYSHDLLKGRGALVRPELLAQLNVNVGDTLVIGTQPFQIRGVVLSEPGRRLGAFTLGPRVFIDAADIDSTGLLGFGSRSNREILLRVPPAQVQPLLPRLRDAFANDFVRVRSYRASEDDLGEDLTRTENYLSLVGLVVLILGGIGVSSVTRVFVQQKIRSIAILKCIGGTSRQVLAVYLTQVILLGFAGSLLGVGIAGAALRAIPSLLGDLTTLLPVDYSLTAAAVAQGLLIGVLVSVLFSIVPLLEVRLVKPSLLLRQDIPASSRFDWTKWLMTGAVGAALVAVASWQAGSLRVGLVLSGGFVALAFVLHLAGAGLIRAVQPLRYARSFALRQAVLHVARPGNQTRVILLAVGLGTFFILGVQSLQANLLRDFTLQVGENAPDMFLMDIQEDQATAVSAFVDGANGRAPAPRVIPVLRARVVGVQGQQIDLDNYQEVRGRGGLAREYTVTYRPQLEANETLVAGQWWGDAPVTPETAEVSIEEAFFQPRTGGPGGRGRGPGAPSATPAPSRINVGDRMRFDVLGRVITARVTSIRRVQWQDFRAGGFMFVFRPGSFGEAPHTFISTLQGPSDPDARARMQANLVERFPNVSVIDLREMLQTIQGIVRNVTLAITVVGGLVLFSGILILVGAVSMTKFRRVYEAAILKTLGASSRLIATMLLLEYGVLGAIAGTVGAFGAVVLSWAVARFALELPWTATPWITGAGIVVTALLVGAIGVLASLDVLRNKPLSTLRAE
jgi:putative ABC transport system permease protein